MKTKLYEVYDKKKTSNNNQKNKTAIDKASALLKW